MRANCYFSDAYRAPVRHTGATVIAHFFAIFGHHPFWMKIVLIARNRLASFFGLDAPRATDVMHLDVRSSYGIGDTIGVWPIFALSEIELVAGRDNRHLDFRLSVLRVNYAGTESVVVSTICSVHNLSGKIYLFFIVPFHKWGMQRLLRNAVLAGRL